MRTVPNLLSCTAAAGALLAPCGLAQEFLFTTSQPEQTLSGSGGTVLQYLQPNEIIQLRVQPCPGGAEKWAPRTTFHTQAGDEDNDDTIWEAGLMGSIDALLDVRAGFGSSPDQRSIYYSVSQPVGTTVSGAPGLRPGDVGRIARIGTVDGQIEYFMTEEQVKQALGLPLTAVVDIDAVASQPNYGVFFSIDQNTICNLCTTGTTMVRDGDLLMIPASALTWTTSGTVGSVTPGGAVVVHTELQMNLFVQNAQVTNRFGACQTQILDLEAIDLAWGLGTAGAVPTCSGPEPYPYFLFTGESLSGGAILTTQGGGQILNTGCLPYGTSCGFGPTFGNQIGLQPPTTLVGIPSHVAALCTARTLRFVSEAQLPQFPVFGQAEIDFASPGVTTWVFMAFAPTGPGVVAPSTDFGWGDLCYPDYYTLPNWMGFADTTTGFGSFTSVPIPWPVDLVFYGVTITPWGTIEASTPSTVEVF